MAAIKVGGEKFVVKCVCCKRRGVNTLRSTDGRWTPMGYVQEDVLGEIGFVLCCDYCRKENRIKF